MSPCKEHPLCPILCKTLPYLQEIILQRGRMLTKASPSASKGAEPQGCARQGEVPARQLGEPSLPQTLDAARDGHRSLPGGLVRFCGSEARGQAAAVSRAATNSFCPQVLHGKTAEHLPSPFCWRAALPSPSLLLCRFLQPLPTWMKSAVQRTPILTQI